MLIPSLIWNKPLMALPMEWCQQIYLFFYVFFIRKSTINFLIIVTIHDSLSKCFVVSKYQPKITNLSVICKILIVSTLLNWFQSMAPSISSGDETCLRWGFLLLMGSIPGLLVVVCVSLSHAIKVPFLSQLSAWRWWASESK
jgi:hypothetical protein